MNEAVCQKIDDIASNFEDSRLKAIVERLPAGVLVLSRQGVIEFCNSAATALLGEGLMGKRWISVIDGSVDANTVYYGGEIVLNTGRVINIATQSLGAVSGQLILVNDVTETSRLQQRLHHHKRLSAMGEMAAKLAHQIRTPLSTALIYAKQLPEVNRLPEGTVDEYAEKITRQLHQIEQQIKDMLSFSRSGRLAFETVNVEELLQQTKKSSDEIALSTNSNLQIGKVDAAKIKGSSSALLGALQNCVNNAIEAVGKDAEVRLSAELVDDKAVDIIVADQGPGIDDAIQQQVKDAFFTTRSTGTGLGLAVANIVAESHGGKLLLESEKGNGTRVIFRLPLEQG